MGAAPRPKPSAIAAANPLDDRGPGAHVRVSKRALWRTRGADPWKASRPEKTPHTTEEKSLPNPVVHFEVAAKDADAQREFYTSLFGWGTTVYEDADYTMFQTTDDDADGHNGINGGLMQHPQGASHLTVYIEVDDVDAYVAKATEHGATTVMPPMDIPGDRGRIALFTDPEGNVVGLYKPS
jgi:predicted enzyme related to lactoylglutathione lyase